MQQQRPRKTMPRRFFGTTCCSLSFHDAPGLALAWSCCAGWLGVGAWLSGILKDLSLHAELSEQDGGMYRRVYFSQPAPYFVWEGHPYHQPIIFPLPRCRPCAESFWLNDKAEPFPFIYSDCWIPVLGYNVTRFAITGKSPCLLANSKQGTVLPSHLY